MENNDQMIVYTINEVVEILKFSRISIVRYIKKGELKASLIGNQYRIKKENLDAFLESKRK